MSGVVAIFVVARNVSSEPGGADELVASLAVSGDCEPAAQPLMATVVTAAAAKEHLTCFALLGFVLFRA